MSKERWNGLLLCKQEIQEKGPDNSMEYAGLDPRIAASWIRCYQEGLRPMDKPQNKGTFELGVVSRAMTHNELVIEAAKSVFDEIYQYQDDNWPYHLEFVDKDNVRLLGKGLYDDSVYANPIPEENVLGTNCHALVREYHCPVQIFGPENYLESCYKHLVWGAPIFDEDGNYVGGIFLSKRLLNLEWDDLQQAAQINNLYFTCAIAAAVERCWLAKKSIKRCEHEKEFRHNIHELILNLVDNVIITLDRDGYIIHTNHQARHFLGLDESAEKKLDKISFANYLKNPKEFSMLMLRKSSTDFEGWIITNKGEKFCTFYYVPIKMADPDGRIWAYLRIIAKEKEHFKAEKAIGFKTRFCFDNIIGESAVIKDTIETAKHLALSNENILLTGETGSGKELFAQAIHNTYNAGGPFIALNCAAFPPNLIESELFGYEPGSFTGAEKNGRPGKIELANGGTLFLDEIGDMPVDIQAILLRVLQDKQVVRIGSVNYKSVDFRVIAATNQDLKQLIVEKRFRQDLYFRLAVLMLNIPPLRERESDIDMLSRYFLERYCRKNNLPVPEFTPEAHRLFCENRWPGNVRELENAIIYSVNMSRGKTISSKHVSEDVHKGTIGFKGAQISRNTVLMKEKENETMPSLEEMEVLYVEKALEVTNHNVTQAAAMLGISKTTLYRRMKKI